MKHIRAPSRISLGLTLLAALVTAGATPAYADGGMLGAPLIKSGDISVAFIGADAVYSNDVYYFVTIGDLGTATYLFNNHTTAAGTTANPDDSGLNTGDEALFAICVNRAGDSPGTDCANADDIFYTGSADRNSDNLAHAMVWTRTDYESEFGPLDTNIFPPDYTYVVGFEDILGGGDRDFNDAVFAISGVTVMPEPMTMALLATGLVGMTGVGMVRRRRLARA